MIMLYKEAKILQVVLRKSINLKNLQFSRYQLAYRQLFPKTKHTYAYSSLPIRFLSIPYKKYSKSETIWKVFLNISTNKIYSHLNFKHLQYEQNAQD